MADAVLYHVMIPSGLRSDTHDHLTMYSSHQTEDGAVEAAEHLRRGGHPVVHVCKVELTTLHVLDSAVAKDPVGRRVKALLGR